MKDKIISDIKKVSSKYKKQFPKEKVNITRDYYREHGQFSESVVAKELGSFKNAIKECFPENETFARETISIKKNKKEIGKRYFVSSIIAGMDVNAKYIESILNYCKKNNAELVLLAMRGVKKSDEFSKDIYEKYLPYISTEFSFNDNLKALDFLLTPQQIVTLTGISRIAKKGCSLIVAHSKMSLETVPSRIGEYPHIVYSTGCINIPQYTHDRIGKIALQDHLQGGLIVEVQDKKTFHIRPVQCDKKNGFVDLGKYYCGTSISNIESQIITGDAHIGSECTTAFEKTIEIINELKCNTVYFNDLLDARSISHHEDKNIKARYIRPEHQQTLNDELKYVGAFLRNFIDGINHKALFVSVPSNHNDFLNRYLYEGRFVQDIPVNCKLACELLPHYLDDTDPIQYFLETRKHLKKDEIEFPKRDDELNAYGFDVVHGDKGSNGSKGSARTFDKCFDKSVTAHSHSPSIFRNSIRVGTLSLLKQHYIAGSGSSWLHTNCILYANGSYQLINIIDGQWKL